jgi:riboflavin kinase / FMN adenylyltransferase
VEVVDGPEHCVAPAGGSAVTIGAYDGVHLGHRYLLSELRRQATARRLASVVVTFDRHPATVVRPQSAPPILTDRAQKLELLASAGIDRTLVVPFDRARANETAEDFVLEVLVRALNARLVVVGEDFHFGHRRAGNVALLTEMGAQHGFEVVGVSLQDDDAGRVVSSTRIRQLLAAGSVGEAARILGRHHQVRGIVGHGAGRGGAGLGIPTANVEVPAEVAMPSEGIYACLYERPDGSVHRAAVSFGRRPTFDDTEVPVLEAYLFDFEGDLYGEPAKVSFVQRLRDDMRFSSSAELVTQMHKDVEAARAVLEDVG